MSMSPFYAYAINRQSDTYSRFLLIFANRATADEWWREISRDPILSNIRRFTPQFYSYDSSEVQLSQFFYRHKEIGDKFIDRMLIQPENDMNGEKGFSIVPFVDITDHISGNWFHIRSKVDPRLYWCYHGGNGQIILSEHHNERTPFRITALEEPEGTIMIGSDKITIASPKVDIGILPVQGRYLGSRCGTGEFMFQDFAQGKFLSDRSGGDYMLHDPSRRVQQEVWELVCSYTDPVY